MTREAAIAQAQIEAKANKQTLFVVQAPLQHAEDEDGPYGYCPPAALAYLYSGAIVVATVSPHGNLL
jgi:aromatic ring-opening dioxygenase LigB subunit